MLIREYYFFLLRLLLNTLIVIRFRWKWSSILFILRSFFCIFILICFYFNNIWIYLDLLITLVYCYWRIILYKGFFLILNIFSWSLLYYFLLWLILLVWFLVICLLNFNVLRWLLLLHCYLYFSWFFLSTINVILIYFIIFISIYFRFKKCIFRMNITSTIYWVCRLIICADSISWTLRSSHQYVMSCLGLIRVLIRRNTNFLNDIPLVIFKFLKIEGFYNIALRTIMSILVN